MQAQGIANLGQSIGDAIQDYGKLKKQQQQDERDVQKSKSVAKAIGDLIPELKPTLQTVTGFPLTRSLRISRQ